MNYISYHTYILVFYSTSTHIYLKLNFHIQSNYPSVYRIMKYYFVNINIRAFSSVVRQMLAKTARTHPIVVLFYVLFVLYRSMYCLCVNVYYYHRVTTQLQLTNISYHIISYQNLLWPKLKHCLSLAVFVFFLLFQYDYVLFCSHFFYRKFQLLRTVIILLFMDILSLFVSFIHNVFCGHVKLLPLSSYTHIHVFSSLYSYSYMYFYYTCI